MNMAIISSKILSNTSYIIFILLFSKYSDSRFISGLVIIHNPIHVNNIVILLIFNKTLNKSLINMLSSMNINDTIEITINTNLNSLFFDFMEFIFLNESFILMKVCMEIYFYFLRYNKVLLSILALMF